MVNGSAGWTGSRLPVTLAAMKEEDFDTHRATLMARLAELDTLDNANADARDTVQLDQTSVGRLSRMDALQGQAMAKAQAARSQSERRAILAALRRIDEGEFGWCETCGEEIAEGRLALDPTVTRCIGCAR
ncbi:MAG: TraR/DksA family transcriptional regulator [Rubricella sp.]